MPPILLNFALLGQQVTDPVIPTGVGSEWEPEAWLMVGGAVVSIGVAIYLWRLLRYAAREESKERGTGG